MAGRGRSDRDISAIEIRHFRNRPPVHLLQVYSNPSPGVGAPRELLFRSTRSERPMEGGSRSKRARQLRAAEVQQLVDHYLAVRNIRTVARDLGLSRATVARILTEHGVSTSRGMTEIHLAEAAELYEQGLSSFAIGKRLGFDNHTILKGLREQGITIRPQN